MKSSRRYKVLLWIMCLGVPLPPARAVVLNWDTLTWVNGALTGSFDLDANNPGNDVTITLTGDTARFLSDYPKITTANTGGNAPAQKALDLSLDFGNRSESLTVTVDFNYALGVDSTLFMLFDIDKGANGSKAPVDQLRDIKARTLTDTYVAATIADGAANDVAGIGLNQTVTGTGTSGTSSGAGNVTIGFGNNKINQISFVYGHDPAAGSANPTAQNFSFHDLSYRPVPEVGTALVAVLICGAALGARRLQKRRMLDDW